MIGLVLAVGMNFFSYFFSDKMALAMYSAQPVTPEENPEVYARVYPLVQSLAQTDGPADAEAVADRRGFAERVRHRPQSRARFGRVHRREFCS